MTDRRVFIQGGLAASILGGAAIRSAAGEGLWSASRQGLPLHKVLVDSAVPESLAFGEAAARRNVPIHVFERGDLSDYWYHELDPIWRKQRAPLAGLTRHGPLFVLERFAWDRGMRVVLRGEHRPGAGNGDWMHRLSGQEDAVAEAARRINAGSAWAVAMAGVVLRSSTGGKQASVDINATTIDRSGQDALYSWVIA